MSPILKDADSPQAMIWPLVVTAFIAVPLVSLWPWWLPCVALGMAGWEILSAVKRLTPPVRALRLGIFASAIFTAWGEFGGMAALPVFSAVGLIAISAFFILPRSLGQMAWLGFLNCFLITVHVIVAPSWSAFSHAVVGVIVVTSLWVRSVSPSGWPLTRLVVHAAVLFLFGAPFMLFLMLVFPRFGNGGLWEGSGMALTGITDSLYPGNITRLVRDPHVAFRVEFAGGYIPNAHDLYWRGLVLWDTDGLNWFNSEPMPERKGTLAQTGVAVPYEVLLEPQMEKMLYALDPPAGLRMIRPSDVRVKRMQGDAFEVPWNLFERIDYRGLFTPPERNSAPAVGIVGLTTLSPLADEERARALALPENPDPRVSELARSLRGHGRNDMDVVGEALKFFADGGFEYTLAPDREVKSAADFIFGTKKGFCGHFASALAMLLRSADVPARVVLGYQGGGYNRWAGYWLVRQHHAHAWVEAWTGATGWVRADAVRVVAPGRIEDEKGWELWIGGSEGARWLRKTAEFWDGLGFAFNRIAVRQRSALSGSDISWKRALSDMGKGGSSSAAFMAGIAVFLLVVWAGVRARRVEGADALVGVYEKFCARLARQRLDKASHEGPLDYAARITRAYPALTDEIMSAMTEYARLRYGRDMPNTLAIKQLRSRFRRLRLR